MTSGFAALAALVLLAGCASANVEEPAAAPSAPAVSSPTPVADDSATIVALAVGGTGLSALNADGDVVASVDYTVTGQSVVAFLTDAFGTAPALSARAGDASCVADASKAVWGGDAFEVVYDYPERTGIPDGQQFSVSAKASAVGDIAVQTPEGLAVGDPVADLQAAIPDVGTHEPGNGAFYVDYAVVSGTYEDMSDADFGTTGNAYWGAQAESKDGSIAELHAPTYFQSAC